MNCCATCKHYEPEKNPETGRRLPSKPGQCTYAVAWPILPQSYYDVWGKCKLPKPSKMDKESGRSCQTWSPIKEK